MTIGPDFNPNSYTIVATFTANRRGVNIEINDKSYFIAAKAIIKMIPAMMKGLICAR